MSKKDWNVRRLEGWKVRRLEGWKGCCRFSCFQTLLEKVGRLKSWNSCTTLPSRAPQARGEACVTVFERRSHLGPSDDDDDDDPTPSLERVNDSVETLKAHCSQI